MSSMMAARPAGGPLAVTHEPSPTPHEILRSMLVPDRHSVFLLGCFERRITLFHQQVRALNLVYALHQLGYCQGAKIGVVGAGVAGLTAAAALRLIPRCEVTLVEREARLLPVLNRGLKTARRYLDPFLYEWPGTKTPYEAFDRLSGAIPLTGWPPGLQTDVVAWLLKEWERLGREVEVVLGAHEVRLGSKSDPRPTLSWRTDDRGHRSQPFDLVVLAIGFGTERTMLPLEPHPYWEEDDLEAAALRHRSFLVSGVGDGAWTDLFRIAIPRFRQERLRSEFLIDRLVPSRVRLELTELEDRATEEQTLGRDPDGMLTEAYMAIETPRLVDELKRRCEEGTKPRVVVNTRQHIVSRGSFIANRFLGTRLVKAGVVETWLGELAAVGQRDERSPYTVILKDGRADMFDRVILRHGPDPALKQFDPGMFAAWEPALRRVGQIDRTCLPAWTVGGLDLGAALREDRRKPGTHAGRTAAADAIAAYARAIEHWAYVGCSGDALEAGARAIAHSAGSAGGLEHLIESGDVLVSFDEWDRQWAGMARNSLGALAFTEPTRLGLRSKYLPLPLLAENLLPHLTQNTNAAEAVSRTVRETLGAELSSTGLLHWHHQADAHWLVLLSPGSLSSQELVDVLGWLQSELTRTKGFRYIVMERRRAQALSLLRLDLTVLRFDPSEVTSAPSEGDDGLAWVSDRLLKLFPSAEVSHEMLREGVGLFKSDCSDGLNSPVKFGQAYLDRVLDRCDGDRAQDVALLEAVADAIPRSTSPPSKAEVRDRIVNEFHGVMEAQEIEARLERFIEARALEQKFRANPLQPHLSATDPHLHMPDGFLRNYLGALYLVRHPERLMERLRPPHTSTRDQIVLTLSLLIIGEPGTLESKGQVDELLAPLIADTRLDGERLLARLLASGFVMPDDRVDKIRQSLLANPTTWFRTMPDVVTRLAGRDERFIQDLMNLAGAARDDTPPFVRVAAAGAAWVGAGTTAARDALAAWADLDNPLGFRSKLQAIRALYEGGATDLARAAWRALATSRAIAVHHRLEAAEVGANRGDDEAREAIRRLARSLEESSDDRGSAARMLKRIGDHTGATEAFWSLLDGAGPNPARRHAAEMLIEGGAHESERGRMESRLREIAEGVGHEPGDDRFWAAEKLEAIGVYDGIATLWLSISADDSLAIERRVEAAARAAADHENHAEAAQQLALLAVRTDLPPEVRLDAARAYLATSLDRELPEAIVEALATLALDDTQPAAVRASATSIRVDGARLNDPKTELLLFGSSGDAVLRLACAKELETRGSPSYARRLLCDLLRDQAAPAEIRSQAIWRLGFLREWEEIIAACQLGDIGGPALDTALDVFAELGRWSRASHIVRQMVLEGAPWGHDRRERVAYWCKEFPAEVEDLVLSLESSTALPSHIALLREALNSPRDSL